MKINFADSSKEPSLQKLGLIMQEVAEESLIQKRIAAENIEKAIQFHLKQLKKKYRF